MEVDYLSTYKVSIKYLKSHSEQNLGQNSTFLNFQSSSKVHLLNSYHVPVIGGGGEYKQNKESLFSRILIFKEYWLINR